jgi:hypothetical protein
VNSSVASTQLTVSIDDSFPLTVFLNSLSDEPIVPEDDYLQAMFEGGSRVKILIGELCLKQSPVLCPLRTSLR